MGWALKGINQPSKAKKDVQNARLKSKKNIRSWTPKSPKKIYTNFLNKRNYRFVYINYIEDGE